MTLQSLPFVFFLLTCAVLSSPSVFPPLLPNYFCFIGSPFPETSRRSVPTQRAIFFLFFFFTSHVAHSFFFLSFAKNLSPNLMVAIFQSGANPPTFLLRPPLNLPPSYSVLTQASKPASPLPEEGRLLLSALASFEVPFRLPLN